MSISGPNTTLLIRHPLRGLLSVCVCVLADVVHITQRISCVCLWIRGSKSVCGQSTVSSVLSEMDRETQRKMDGTISCVKIRELCDAMFLKCVYLSVVSEF